MWGRLLGFGIVILLAVAILEWIASHLIAILVVAGTAALVWCIFRYSGISAAMRRALGGAMEGRKTEGIVIENVQPERG